MQRLLRCNRMPSHSLGLLHSSKVPRRPLVLVVRSAPPSPSNSTKSPSNSNSTSSTSSSSNNGSSSGATALQEPLSPSSETSTSDSAQCFATGDSVTCDLPDTPSTSSPLAATTATLSSLRNTALLVFPFFAWGTSMPALKLVMPHIPSPLLLGALRLLPASLILIAWAAATGRRHPSTPEAWAWILLFGLVDGAAFQGFLAEGLTRTSAGLGSVIIDSQPLTVAVLAALLFGEKLGPTALAGLLLGVLGLALVEVPPEAWAVLFAEGQAAVTQPAPGLPPVDGANVLEAWQSGLGTSGEFWMLMAAQSMAVGTVMVRYVTRHADSVYATGYHMLFGGLMLLAAVSAQDPGLIGRAWDAVTPADVAILAYISVLGGAASYGIFFYNASVKGNLTALSSLTFLTPLFAVAGGYLVLNETLTPLQVCGAAVTLAAVYLITNKAPSSAEQ